MHRTLGLIVGFIAISSLASPARALDAEPAQGEAPAKAQASSPKVRRLGLRELWALARSRYPGLIAAHHGIRGAQHQRNEQIFQALPSGEITAYLSWTSPVITRCKENIALSTDKGDRVVLPGGQAQCLTTEGLALNLERDRVSDYLPQSGSGALLRIDARLVQPLFTFGKLKAGIELGQLGVDMAKYSQEVTLSDLALNLLRTYYGLKTARAALDTIREGHEQITKWVKRIDEELEKGKGSYTEIDLMRLKVADSQVQMAELDLDRTVKGTLAALRFLTQDDGVDVDDEDLVKEYDETRESSYYKEMALVHRPELKLLNATGKGAKLYRDLRVAELLPDLGLVTTFNYGLTQNVEDTPHAFMNRVNYIGAGIGLGLRMPLDFGPRAARLQKAIEDMRLYEARRKEALGGGALELERAYLDLREAQQRLKAAEVAERRARGWLQGIKQNMDVGTAESRDMIDALRAYFDQRLLVLRTINDVNSQAAWMRRLAGLEIIPSISGPGSGAPR